MLIRPALRNGGSTDWSMPRTCLNSIKGFPRRKSTISWYMLPVHAPAHVQKRLLSKILCLCFIGDDLWVYVVRNVQCMHCNYYTSLIQWSQWSNDWILKLQLQQSPIFEWLRRLQLRSFIRVFFHMHSQHRNILNDASVFPPWLHDIMGPLAWWWQQHPSVVQCHHIISNKYLIVRTCTASLLTNVLRLDQCRRRS